MSFSSKVKEELSRQISGGRHCQIAEIAAIISFCGRIQISEQDKYCIKIHTENVAVARKYFTLLKKTFN
ncbi:MAG: DNA-binding protein WhiA, partial [Lachnospiraceae bacterium]